MYKKILILILCTAIFPVVFLSTGVLGVESITIESVSVAPSISIGEESKILTNVKNDGTVNIININVVIHASGKDICNEKINLLNSGETETVSCVWIPDDCNIGKDYILSAIAKARGLYAVSDTIFVRVTGKMYDINITENPPVNNELAFTVKDEDKKLVDDAEIKIEFQGNLLSINDTKTRNGIFKFTPTKEGIYTLFIEKEREGYCKIIKKEINVKNSFIIHGLKSYYRIDEYLDIKVTDSNNNIIDKVNIIVSGPFRREFAITNGTLRFKFKDYGFEKGDYFIVFQEYKVKQDDALIFSELTEKFVLGDEPLPEPEKETELEPEEKPEEGAKEKPEEGAKEKPEEETKEKPEEGPEHAEGNISNISGLEPGSEAITKDVSKKSFLEKYWLIVLILVVILIILIIILIFILKEQKEQKPEKGQKSRGLSDL